jgi:hypothetical protein
MYPAKYSTGMLFQNETSVIEWVWNASNSVSSTRNIFRCETLEVHTHACMHTHSHTHTLSLSHMPHLCAFLTMVLCSLVCILLGPSWKNFKSDRRKMYSNLEYSCFHIFWLCIPCWIWFSFIIDKKSIVVRLTTLQLFHCTQSNYFSFH